MFPVREVTGKGAWSAPLDERWSVDARWGCYLGRLWVLLSSLCRSLSISSAIFRR